MARESETFRLNLEEIKTAYPDKTNLTITEVSRYLNKHYDILKNDRKLINLCFVTGKRYYISLVNLAHYVSGDVSRRY